MLKFKTWFHNNKNEDDQLYQKRNDFFYKNIVTDCKDYQMNLYPIISSKILVQIHSKTFKKNGTLNLSNESRVIINNYKRKINDKICYT